jgi:hypothetical protein
MHNDIFYRHLLSPALAASPLLLFTKFREYEGSYGIDYARKCWVGLAEKPSICKVGISFHIDPALENRVLRYAEVTANWSHLGVLGLMGKKWSAAWTWRALS